MTDQSISYKDYLGNAFDISSGEFNFEEAEKEAIEKKEKINILLMGQSGVGKSTLINAFFGVDMAKAGVGAPVTKRLEKFYFKEKGLIFWDTKGIEAVDYQETFNDLKVELNKAEKEAVKQNAIDSLPHVAWLCIKETSGRIEPREFELVKLVHDEFNIPVVVVFTQTQYESGEQFAKVEAPKLFDKNGCEKAINNHYARVNSVDYSIGGHKISKSGLDELQLMTEQATKGKKGAEIALKKAQTHNSKLRLEAMISSSQNKVHIAAVAAGTAGASPIPGSDAPIIAAIQSTLIYTINSEFEIDSQISITSSTITGILGVTAIAQVGKAVVSNLLKFIPVAGTLIGGTISATAAIAITEAVGRAYIKVLENYYDIDQAKVILPKDTETILTMFEKFFLMFKK